MSAIIHIADNTGHHYTVDLGIMQGFDSDALGEWYTSQIEEYDSLILTDSGMVSPSCILRIWYTTREVR